MAIRDLSDLDRDINQGLGRQISENITDGTSADEQVLSEGGIIAGQSAQGTLAVSATKVYTLGTKLTQDGKIYRYAKGSTTTALTAGYLTESPEFGGAYDVVEEDGVVPASGGGTSGAYTIVAEQLSSVCAADRFKDGTIITLGSVAVGGGQVRKISGNTVSTGTGSEVTYTVTESWSVTVTTGATVSILANPYKNILTTTTGGPLGGVAGYSRVAVPVATPYCWVQRRGIAAIHVGSTGVALGRKLHRDITSSGGGAVRIDSVSCGKHVITEEVGYALNVADAHDFTIAYLEIE